MTVAELRELLALRKLGHSYESIASLSGRSISTVYENLHEFEDTTEEGKALLRGSGLAIVRKLLKSDNDETNLELIDRIGVAEKKRDSGIRNQNVIVLGTPGHPAGSNPVIIDLSPVPRGELPGVSTG